MATTLIIKNSSVAGKVPDPSALQAGELGVNLKDQKLYSKDADGNVFELGRGSTASGGSGEKPGSPAIGDLYYDTDLDVLLVWNGSEWETVGSVTSVNGKTGEVVLEASDVGALGATDQAVDSDKLDGEDGAYYLDFNNLTNVPPVDAALWAEDGGKLSPATITNDVAVGTTTFRDNADIIAALPALLRERFAAVLSEWETATPYVVGEPSTLPADESLRDAITRVTTAGKINLNADGTATFAGKVTAADFDIESLPSLP